MDSDRWERLSAWHNAWLAARPNERRRLRDELADRQPDLVAEVDVLLSVGESMSGFLETPAFVLAARQLALESPDLPAGAIVGPYRVVDLIARGGMGLVYRATDDRLGRDVALKLSEPSAPFDPMRVERFLQEARVTASIDHPNVVKVYDVGLVDGRPYIVVELLEGETLRARLERGPLPIVEARRIVTDIARGLVAATAAGLVHRDLKPENIFLTRSGSTKILDFGIAKLAPGTSADRPSETLTGIMLGTTGYLAPEQIRGDEVDARADLFALGSIAFEMFTGQRAFAGEHTVAILHAILQTPVQDVMALRPETPPVLATVIARLLEKSPGDRFQSAADLVWALEHVEDSPATTRRAIHDMNDAEAPAKRTWWRPRLAASLGLVALLFGAWSVGRSYGPTPEVAGLARFEWTLPAGTRLFSAPVVSPDGRSIAWAGIDGTGASRLFVRALASPEAIALPGTEGARHPFWSPDSLELGFFAGGRLKRIAVDGGAPVVLATTGDPADARGGAWSSTGVIVFQAAYRDAGLLRVSAQGGEVAPATAFDGANEDVTHRWPVFLPDGIHFLYHVLSMRDDRRGVYLGSLDAPLGKPGELLFTSESGVVYAPAGANGPGVLLGVANGHIESRRFDVERLTLVGDAWSLGVPAVGTSPHDAALVSAATNTLAYSTVPIPWGAQFASIGVDGSGLRVSPGQQLGGFPRLSPDGRRLARAVVDTARGNPDIWVEDLERGTQLRVTTSRDFDVLPVWSPDGREVAYRSGARNAPTIAVAAADGTGVTRTMACPRSPCEPSDWTADGRSLIVTVQGADVWSLPVSPGGQPAPLLAEPFTERDARVSSDGRWMAYVSDESGRPEVSVRSLTGTRRRYVVSTGGGDQPVWRHDGAELFFADAAGRLHSVPVRAGPQGSLVFGAAIELKVPSLGARHWGTTYDVSADGRRVFFAHPVDARPPREFGVVLGWSALVK